jgi:hypothetical protein
MIFYLKDLELPEVSRRSLLASFLSFFSAASSGFAFALFIFACSFLSQAFSPEDIAGFFLSIVIYNYHILFFTEKHMMCLDLLDPRDLQHSKITIH